MRIGIITLPLNRNYGGILQAYALQAFLRKKGNEVCLVEKRDNLLIKTLKKLQYFLFELKEHHVLIGSTQTDEETLLQDINKFIVNYINRRVVKKYSEINENDFDAFIVGSDQIWRPKYNGKVFKSKMFKAYLSFTKGWNVKRISYSVSFGTDQWEYTKHQTRICKKLIHRFDAVSVREKSGVGLCKKYFDIDVQWLIDPTMLLSKDDYVKLFQKANTQKSKGTLLVYILDKSQEKSELVDVIASDLCLQPFCVNQPENNVLQSIEQWLRGFYDAEFIVTDSFHACVFSILFNKPFVVYGNQERGLSRFTSLLEMFGLENRLITNYSEFYNIKNNEIDWSKTNLNLSLQRKKAYSFIRTALE